ncbi:MAG: RcnB family protein [Sphingorhabdus sp.]
MKTVLFSGIAATALLFSPSDASASDSWSAVSKAGTSLDLGTVANGAKPRGGMPNMPGMGMPKPGVAHMAGGHHGGSKPPMMNRPRPGFHGIPPHDVYRRPFLGFFVPRYWIQPRFYLYNFRNYGLSAPSYGYNWSRYYDDAVLMDSRGYVQDYRSDIDWGAGYAPQDGGYTEPDYGPSIRPDAEAYNWGENGNVAFAAPDGSSYSYDGAWEGEYVDPQGRVFEGEWEGTVTRHDGVSGPGHPAGPGHAGAPYPADPAYDVPHGYEGYERCLKSNGLTGAAIGAVLGGIAGNRIAGRGDRLGGTLIGAGIGGIAGVAIEKATAKCRSHAPRYDEQAHVPYPHQGYGYGWQGGYYYYPHAPMVTTVMLIPGSTTTTVTEEITYETIPVAPRKKAVRKWKPKPKPRCVCR